MSFAFYASVEDHLGAFGKNGLLTRLLDIDKMDIRGGHYTFDFLMFSRERSKKGTRIDHRIENR